MTGVTDEQCSQNGQKLGVQRIYLNGGTSILNVSVIP